MLRTKVQVFFKKQGFRLEPKATNYIVESLEKVEDDKHGAIMQRMINELLQQDIDSSLISLDVIKDTVKCLTSSNAVTLFQTIDAFNVPILKYNDDTRRFYVKKKESQKHFTTLVSDNDNDKSKILKDRYKFIMERLIRNEIFDLSNDSDEGLKTVEHLLSSGSRACNVTVLGMLSQLQEDVWCLEDVSGIVKININDTEYHKGLVLEGAFVLAQGKYEDRIFVVKVLALPPLESAHSSRNAVMSRTNYFGGLPADTSIKMCPQITKHSNKNMSGKTLVFISDMWLDKEIVFSKLETLFSGYTSLKPGAFIFCGNFLSPEMATSPESVKLKYLKAAIKRTVLLFAVYRELALNSHLVFVPGPNDPSMSNKNVLPRAPMPATVILEHIFNGTIPNLKDSERIELKSRIILATNPCRMTYYDKEIVVFRDNIGQKMYRHCMYIPIEDQTLNVSQSIDNSLNMSANNTMLDESEVDRDSKTNFLESQLVHTILSQAHLMPIPLHANPVYWGHDQALRLFPTPDLVVLADPGITSFDMKLSDCTFVNPPSFSNGDSFNFKIYYPYDGVIESCSLDI